MTLYILLALAICGTFFVGFMVGSLSKQGKIRKLERKLKQMEAKKREGKEPRPALEMSQSGSQSPVHSSGRSGEELRSRGNTGGPGRDVLGNGKAEAPAVKTDGNQAAGIKTRDQWYQKFGQAGTLAVHFNYSFPDKMYFQPGTGYIRNARNQVIPNKTVFSTVNTATGYAMEGLFWVFNVIYRGKEYTFQEIMDGQMTTGYVRIEGIPALTVVEPTGVDGCYRLIQKGKLKIVDV